MKLFAKIVEENKDIRDLIKKDEIKSKKLVSLEKFKSISKTDRIPNIQEFE